jgi:methyl-accepting chemotaxis protein
MKNSRTLFIEQFIPASLNNDADAFRRGKLLVSIAFITVAACPVLAFSYFFQKHYWAIAFLLSTSVIAFGIPFIFRATGSLKFGGYALCGLIFLVFNSLTFTTNGLQSTAFQWIAIIPLIAGLTLGRREMTIWAGLCAATALVYYIAWLTGFRFINKILPEGLVRSEFVSVAALILVLMLIVRMFENGREQAFAAMKILNDEAIELNQNIAKAQAQAERGKRKFEDMAYETNKHNEYLGYAIDDMLEAMQRFSNGDLTVKFEVTGNDNISRLFVAFNSTVESIRGLAVKVVETVQATASAGIEISSSTDEMSSTASNQALQITKVSEVIDHISNHIHESSQMARDFAQKAERTAAESAQNAKVVEQAIAGMQRIEEVVMKSAETMEALGNSSNQIGEIVQVINEIADQTNLLALNAAIEAARAGDQGRGFAVVADEVRKLAERTTKATKEIATMIQKIQKDTVEAVSVIRRGTGEVANGKNLVMQTGTALEVFMHNAKESATVYSKVVQASTTQAEEISELASSVEAISQMIQHSAMGSEHIAFAVNDLSQLTERLQQLVRRFKTDRNTLLMSTSPPRYEKNWRQLLQDE